MDLLKTMDGVLDFRKVCIDHKNIRNEVVRDTKGYNIKEVPCIFVMHSNGKLDKFEGVDAFGWVRDTLNSMKRMSEEIMMSTQPSSQPQPLPPPKPFVDLSEMVMDKKVVEEEKLSELSELSKTSRQIDTAPLIMSPKEDEVEDLMDQQQKVKGVKKSGGGEMSIQNMAAMLQAEREKEDEAHNPNALSKM